MITKINCPNETNLIFRPFNLVNYDVRALVQFEVSMTRLNVMVSTQPVVYVFKSCATL